MEHVSKSNQLRCKTVNLKPSYTHFHFFPVFLSPLCAHIQNDLTVSYAPNLSIVSVRWTVRFDVVVKYDTAVSLPV